MACAPVEFNYSTWIETFPEFGSVSQPAAQSYFAMATTIQRNDGTGPVTNPVTQLMLLNLLTAHFCYLFRQSYGDAVPGAPKPANSPVGRISQASQGSVNVSFDYNASVSEQQAFFIQSKYGAAWWGTTPQYRMAFYIPGRLQSGGLGPNAGYAYPDYVAGRRFF